MKEVITIYIEYGSKKQESIWRTSLELVLDIVRTQMREGHVKNKMKYMVEEVAKGSNLS